MEAVIDTKAPKTWGMLYEYLPHVMVKETLSFLEPVSWDEQAFGPIRHIQTGFWEKMDFKTDGHLIMEEAIYSNNMDMLLRCIKPDIRWDTGRTVRLMCGLGRPHMLDIIKDSITDKYIKGGLVNACNTGSIESVRYITSHFPHINNGTAFNRAVYWNSSDIINLLLVHPVHSIFYKKMAIQCACKRGHTGRVKRLVAEIKDAGGKISVGELNTWLSLAASHEYISIVKYTIELGATDIARAIDDLSPCLKKEGRMWDDQFVLQDYLEGVQREMEARETSIHIVEFADPDILRFDI
jgi:hypothetical protein